MRNAYAYISYSTHHHRNRTIHHCHMKYYLWVLAGNSNELFHNHIDEWVGSTLIIYLFIWLEVLFNIVEWCIWNSNTAGHVLFMQKSNSA